MSHTLLGLLGRSGTGTVRGGGLLCQTSDASERPTWKTAGRQGEEGEGLSCVWRAGGGKGIRDLLLLIACGLLGMNSSRPPGRAVGLVFEFSVNPWPDHLLNPAVTF